VSINHRRIIVAGLLCLTGCGSISDYEPLGSGYIWVTHTQNSISEPSAHQFALEYSPGKGKRWKKVWPDLYGGIVVTNGVAVFVAIKAYGPHTWGTPWESTSRPRLFAVRAPDYPLDITGPVLALTAKHRGQNLSEIENSAGFESLHQTSNGIKIRFATRNWFDDVELSWNQVSNIMIDVKNHGVVRKDLRFGSKYIKMETMPNTTLEPTATAP
jgi:hypothetical protein